MLIPALQKKGKSLTVRSVAIGSAIGPAMPAPEITTPGNLKKKIEQAMFPALQFFIPLHQAVYHI
jgi:hypothetical protein